MKIVWDFVIKHEFWFSMLIIVGLYIGEYRMRENWMGEIGFFLFMIAITPLQFTQCGEKINNEDS